MKCDPGTVAEVLGCTVPSTRGFCVALVVKVSDTGLFVTELHHANDILFAH